MNEFRRWDERLRSWKIELTSNDGTTNTRTILGVMSDNLFALLTKDVNQSLVYSVGKVWVFLMSAEGANQPYVVQRSISSNGTSLFQVSLLADNGSDTTGRESSGSSTDEDGEFSEELSLLDGRLDTKEVGKDTDNGQELIGRVTKVSCIACNLFTSPSTTGRQCQTHKPSPACKCFDPRTSLQSRSSRKGSIGRPLRGKDRQSSSRMTALLACWKTRR